MFKGSLVALITPFANGKVAVNTTGFWGISGLTKSKIEWDIAPLWKGKQQAVTAFGSGLAVACPAGRCSCTVVSVPGGL